MTPRGDRPRSGRGVKGVAAVTRHHLAIFRWPVAGQEVLCFRSLADLTRIGPGCGEVDRGGQLCVECSLGQDELDRLEGEGL